MHLGPMPHIQRDWRSYWKEQYTELLYTIVYDDNTVEKRIVRIEGVCFMPHDIDSEPVEELTSSLIEVMTNGAPCSHTVEVISCEYMPYHEWIQMRTALRESGEQRVHASNIRNQARGFIVGILFALFSAIMWYFFQ